MPFLLRGCCVDTGWNDRHWLSAGGTMLLITLPGPGTPEIKFIVAAWYIFCMWRLRTSKITRSGDGVDLVLYKYTLIEIWWYDAM